MAAKKPIVLTEDLIKIWSERTGKDEALLKELLALHTKYIDHLIDNEEGCLSINLPNMGKLRQNYYMSLSYLQYIEKGSRYFEWLTKKVDLMREIGSAINHDAINYNRPIFTKQIYKIFKNKAKGAFAKFYMYWNMIENSHNDWYVEKVKK